MKSRFYALLILLFPIAAKAQQDFKNFQLGFTLTPNLGWARINDSSPSYSSEGTNVGFSYGLIGDFGFSKNYFFSTAFTLTSINTKVSNTDVEESGGAVRNDITYKVQYIEIPLTIKLKTNEVAEKCFYGQFGLGTGIKVSGKLDSELKSSTGVLSEESKKDIASDNVFRLSLVAGAGMQWNFAQNTKFLTGVTFNNGFTNMLSKGPSIRNSYVALNLGVLF
ncbi:porin family protein [Desertivirga xinjiangensis]|uniref:porin family protein n=1 Tax=Desertivirga xinjiangensis TaxID=539206 RepID=UPI00210B2364|nr:porin family protein [Pedobacter xinjiangensis]